MLDTLPLSLTQVEKRYHGRAVLREISLNLAQGEIFGLIGLNGAGKTTMIKIILDLINADKGEAMLFGTSCHDPSARKSLSYLPEKFQPSRYLTGFEYLDLSLSYYGRRLDRKEAMEKAEALDLDPNVLAARVGSYSKGMGQKLGLAGAFLSDAPLLILDEPMSGLDPRARIRLKEELLRARANGRTVFFSSHILSDIDEICDRIAVLHEGDLRFTGTPVDFKRQFVAQGALNLEQAFLRAIEGTEAGQQAA